MAEIQWLCCPHVERKADGFPILEPNGLWIEMAPHCILLTCQFCADVVRARVLTDVAQAALMTPRHLRVVLEQEQEASS